MTKKDFERIAAVLRYCHEHSNNDGETVTVDWVAEKFAEDLVSANPRFDRHRFLRAAGAR